MLWPTPFQEFTLQGRMLSNPYRIDAAKPCPLGGQPHAETLRASVLAAAELEFNDEKGLRWQDYIEKLQASVAHDRRANGPHNFGYNGDRSHGAMYPVDRSRYVTVEGTRY
jgi:hypothetical protein